MNSKKFLIFLISLVFLLTLDLVLNDHLSSPFYPLWWLATLFVLVCSEAFALFWLLQQNRKQTGRFKKLEGDLQQCRERNQSKTSFIANTSHEIRTPVGAILGFTKLLEDPSLSPDQREHYGAIIRKTGDSLLTILNDILDISKIEAGCVDIETKSFRLRPLLEEVRSVCLAKHGKEGVQTLIEILEPVDDCIASDPQRLQQILINILSNALKFTERGQVVLQVKQTECDIVFKVRDTGMGIPLESQAMLFRAFSQIENGLSNTVEGTGLGLVLSRNLARLLGGDLSLDYSEYGKGSSFMLSIPRNTNSTMSAPMDVSKLGGISSSEPIGAIAGKKILLVDDSDINRLMLEHILLKVGIEVETATNGEEALERALKGNYDALLMDVQMPIMDGHEATKQLRSLGYSRPIIALTAHAMKADRERCLSSGYNDYLSKPVEFDHLFSTIARAIQFSPNGPHLDIPAGQN